MVKINNGNIILNYLDDIELKNFYLSDKELYKIVNDKLFLTWLVDLIKKGYIIDYDITDFQHVIDELSNYFIQIYNNYDGDLSDIDINIKSYITDFTDITKNIINPSYYSINSDDKLNYIYLNYIENNKKTTLNVNKYTGIIYSSYDNFNSEFNNKKIDDVLEILNFKKYNSLSYKNSLNYSDIEKCVNKHNKDLDLRNKLLSKVAIKILYNKNTRPELNYVISEYYIKSINKYLNIDLKYDDIDNIMFYDYSEIEDDFKYVKK